MVEAQTSLTDAPESAGDKIYEGRLYVKLPDWEDRRKRLERTCRDLARRYRNVDAGAKAQNAPVDRFLLDTMFDHAMRARFYLCALTLQGSTRNKINVALRLNGDSRPDWPLRKGVALVAKAQWLVRSRDGQHAHRSPELEIVSFHAVASGDALEFEATLDVTCMQVARLDRTGRGLRERERPDNVLTTDLADGLRPISEETEAKLKDWKDFLAWKRRVIQANQAALRYTSRRLGDDERSVVFTTVAESQEDLEQTVKRLSKPDELVALDTSVSKDEWEFQLPDKAREPRGGEKRPPAQSDASRRSRSALAKSRHR